MSSARRFAAAGLRKSAETVTGIRFATLPRLFPGPRRFKLMPRPKKSLTHSALAAYLCIGVAILLLLGVCGWFAFRDARTARLTLLQLKVSELRALAQRAVGRIERDLEQQSIVELGKLNAEDWASSRWAVPADPKQGRYAAIVTLRNRVVLHTNPELVGEHRGWPWFERFLPEVGDDVVVTRSQVLAGEPAYDIRVPIILNGQTVGDYHTGFTIAWFDRLAQTQLNQFSPGRILLVGGVLLIVLLATTSLFYIAANVLRLHKAMSQHELQRTTETSQLAAGMAHEIRNPMHAIRLNLHALAKVDGENRLRLSREEHNRLLAESNREIDRVERLMQEFLDFANPDAPRNETVDLTAEIQSTLDFVQREMERQQITVQTNFPEATVYVRMDSDRLRQLLLNLLRNAEQALDGPGRIDVSITPTDRYALVTIANSGPAISASDRERIFEPFYSTKKNGSGLGLPLVRRFVNEANGTIACEDNGHHGTVFRIKLPRYHQPSKRNYLL
jgi:signal transduction histidine kinase